MKPEPLPPTTKPVPSQNSSHQSSFTQRVIANPNGTNKIHSSPDYSHQLFSAPHLSASLIPSHSCPSCNSWSPSAPLRTPSHLDPHRRPHRHHLKQLHHLPIPQPHAPMARHKTSTL
jgi:hypothetical protein